MSAAFTLDQQLADSSALVLDWPLSQLRLKDDRRFPWLLLVPRRPAIAEFTDLDPDDYRLLCAEILAASKLLQEVAAPDKLNVGMLGNIVAQMHVHVIGRFHTDAAWPGNVWAAGDGAPYPAEQLSDLVGLYCRAAEPLTPSR
jgi:diadenosine tetraphosphate (Ap4A) HIT family hydrolase